ncbi:23S rRNA pseudouridine(2604) synthase [Pandoraea iniqua]|uniref:Dual-specificity RNA pseudouridine synthase RluF n=1 Tax=Pandoraea iniqua TaxID=2508288 RepID=A0A5E4ZAF2_9BURK|nr:pseudouridine synthase [Pandoraea iniqua]VVE57582.1 23S rRNA pseudouridine(2604) synthase [Pandoraea iniqua]
MSDTPRAKLGAKHPRTLDKTRAPVRSSGALRRPTKSVPASMLDGSGVKKKPTGPRPSRPRPAGDDFTQATGGTRRPAGPAGAGAGAAPRKPAGSGKPFEKRPYGERPPARGQRERVAGARPARADDDRPPRRFDEDRPRRAPEGGARGEQGRPFNRGADDRAPRRFDDNRPRRAPEGGARGDQGRPFNRGADDRAPRRFDEDRPRRAPEGGARGEQSRPFNRGADDRAPRRFDDNRPRRAPEGGARGEQARPFNRGADDRAPRRFDEDRPRRAPEGGARGDQARPYNRGADDRAPRRSPEGAPPRGRFGNDERGARPARATRPTRVERDDDDDIKVHNDAAGSLRLSKRMSELGLCSRREADEWIAKGWVRVDGKVVTELGTRILPTQDITVVQAARKEQANRMTIIIHKPVGYVSGQAEDGYEPAIVLVTRENHWAEDDAGVRFSPTHLRSLAPAGRLDIDSTGVLVLTQDGRIAKQLIGEDSDVEKEYLVRVSYDGQEQNVQALFPESRLALLRHGLELDDQPLKPAQVEWQNPEQLRFVLKEGKKRQIRRMCELVGLHVTGLKRVRMGRVTLGNLPVGEWRYLRPGEEF